MYYLPWWMQWAQAIALIVISCLGSWIAFKQSRIAAAKLNLDLYDKRFKVFEAARACLVFALQEGDLTPGVMNAFYVGTADAIFLFNKSLEDYLDEFRKRMIKFQMSTYSIKNLGPDEDVKRGELADLMAAQMALLNNELPILVDKFGPFLKLGNI